MPQAGMEKSMEEILERVQRDYAEQAKQEAQADRYADAQDAKRDTSTGAPEELSNWQSLRRADIEQARQHVARQREAVLMRQAAELKELDTHQEEIEKLERLIASFTHKHSAFD